MIKTIAKKVSSLIISDYHLYKIFYIDKAKLSDESLPSGIDFIELKDGLPEYDSDLLSKNKSYLGEGAIGYACLYQEKIVGVCFFWFGDRYKRRNFIKLSASEAKLVQVETCKSMRNRGIAQGLIKYSSRQLIDSHGFSKLYARIWHSNIPSIKSFVRSGWQYRESIVEINFKLLPKLRFSWKGHQQSYNK